MCFESSVEHCFIEKEKTPQAVYFNLKFLIKFYWMCDVFSNKIHYCYFKIERTVGNSVSCK